MTALKRYQRLECTGLWRESPGAQRRDVAVSFGEATLIISELRSGRTLTHWSLPAVVRLNPGVLPAVFSPGLEAGETIEIDDLDMIAAIAAVRAALDGPARTLPRLRLWLLAVAVLGVAGLALFWLPGALVAHTVSVVPAAKRAEIGERLIADIAAITGPDCRAPGAAGALGRLAERLFGAGGGRIVVVPRGLAVSASVPGRTVLIARRLIEEADGPEAAAGAILAERLRTEAEDPLARVLRAAGLRATLTLLLTGNLPDGALAGQAERLLAAPPAPVPDDALLALMDAAGVPAAPYARAIDPTGTTTAGLLAGDPFRDAPPQRPLLSDDDWVRLQGICGG